MGELEAGAGRACITPPLGVPLGGYAARIETSRGVHDDLYSRALVLYDGDNYAALVSTELLYVTRKLVESVRKLVEEEVGIPRDSILISAVHTHSGPSILGFHLVEEYRFLDDYISLLPGLVASSLIEACRELRKAEVRWGKGRVDGWTINRRKPLEGPLDNEVIALSVNAREGRCIGSLVNFTCHAVVLGHNNLLVSADYPGYVSRTVEKLLGGECLFMNGACGDVNPMTPGTRIERVYDRSVGTFKDAEMMGVAIGCEAVKVLCSASSRLDVKVATAKKCLELRVRRLPEFSEEEIEEIKVRYRDLLRRGKADEALKVGWRLRTMEFTRRLREEFPGGIVKTEIQAIRVGGLVIVALPGEPMVEIGLAIKSSSKADVTAVVGYSNDALGYLPTNRAFDEGGYEVSLPVCIVDRGAEEKIVSTALSLVDEVLSA